MADNVVYADDSKETVDIINLLLLGWILLGLIVYILGNIIASQLQKRKSKAVPAPAPETSAPTCPEKVSPKPDESVSAPVVSETQVEDIKEELEENIPKLTTVPECIGGEADTVRWVNDVLSWIYTQGIVSPILDAWMSALNARTRMSSTEHGILVDFKDITPESQPPLLTDIVACDDDRKDQVILCQVDAQTLGFEIAVTQFKEKEKNTFPGTLNVQTLSGKLNIECLPDNIFVIKFVEHPQLKLKLTDESLKMFPPEDKSAMQDLIYDIATDAFTAAIVQVRLSSYSECPRRNSYKTLSDSGTLEFLGEKSESKLVVKVIKAEDLGGSIGCSKPYCVVEMDDPPQRFETSDVEHRNSPVWDESFVFAVNGQNAELLFEIYDKGSKQDENFLGLCIVSIEEVLKSAGQQLVIPLEARPLENDTITGSIVLEFNVLYNDKQIGDGHITRNGEILKPGKVVETNSRITAGGTVITTTTIKRTTEG